MALSRLRWGLGLAITVVALVVAVRALGAYGAHRLWLGCLSVLLLGAIAVAGMLSLWRARQRVAHALDGLAATPPRGDWVTRRRARLQAVHDAGATADLDALANATAAEERGQAYLGRYFVAVTVLVGLVGTFAGLMDTLHGVTPLLRDDGLATVQALALPLAGLDVTFGASVVGILVTLALALVQGDLVLAEEQALAQLEELTAHVLVPSIWPKSERAEERLARDMAELRRDVQSALATAGESTATRVAAVARGEVDRLVEAARAAMAGAATATADAARTIQAATVAEAERSGAAVAAAAAVLTQVGERAGAALELVGTRTATALTQATGALTKAGEQTTVALANAGTQTTVALANAGTQTTAALAQVGEQTTLALAKAGEQTTLPLAKAG